jgi:hypothetical protein
MVLTEQLTPDVCHGLLTVRCGSAASPPIRQSRYLCPGSQPRISSHSNKLYSLSVLCYFAHENETGSSHGRERSSCIVHEVVTMHIDASGETRLYGQPVGASSTASQPFRPHATSAIHFPYVVCDKGLCMQLQLIDQHASSPRFAYALCPCLYRDHAVRRNLIGE